MKKIYEAVIQSRVKKIYEADGWLVNKIMLCSKPGWPDLECFKNGVTVFVECKRPGEVPEPLQLYRHKKLRDAGFTVFWFANIDEIRLP